jgi:hypothetical protein
MKTWAGGGTADSGPPLPRPRPSKFGAPQAPGPSNTRYKNKKKTKSDIVCNFKNLPQKASSAIGENFEGWA